MLLCNQQGKLLCNAEGKLIDDLEISNKYVCAFIASTAEWQPPLPLNWWRETSLQNTGSCIITGNVEGIFLLYQDYSWPMTIKITAIAQGINTPNKTRLIAPTAGEVILRQWAWRENTFLWAWVPSWSVPHTSDRNEFISMVESTQMPVSYVNEPIDLSYFSPDQPIKIGGVATPIAALDIEITML